MNSTQNKILLISPESWGNNFVSKHHYAKYLAKKNTVYFLNPVEKSSVNPFKKIKLESKKIDDNLILISYQNLIPRLNDLPKFIQKHFYKKQAKQIQKQLKISEFNIIWSFDPFRFWDLKCFKSKYRIYHTVDVHFRKCFEKSIASSADIVLLSSELLKEKLSDSNANIHNIGHAADLDQFEKKTDLKKVSIPGENSIKAGLVGNFNQNVDYKLIENIAKTNPKIDFIFIGPYQTNNLGDNHANILSIIQNLESLDNIFFLGEKPSKEIIYWLKEFDINLVLYKEEKRDIIINPHKMMGYFYSGKITVCSWFNQYKTSDKDFLYMADKNAEIPNIIHNLSENLSHWNNEAFQSKRRNFAIENSYTNKIDSIFKLLNEK